MKRRFKKGDRVIVDDGCWPPYLGTIIGVDSSTLPYLVQGDHVPTPESLPMVWWLDDTTITLLTPVGEALYGL